MKEQKTVRITLVVRELGKHSIDHSMEFDLPEIPKVGDYISVFSPDSPGRSKDIIVRHVWWHLVANEGDVGRVQDIMVECDVALGPYGSPQWRAWCRAADGRGVQVDKFQVARIVTPDLGGEEESAE